MLRPLGLLHQPLGAGRGRGIATAAAQQPAPLSGVKGYCNQPPWTLEEFEEGLPSFEIWKGGAKAGLGSLRLFLVSFSLVFYFVCRRLSGALKIDI